LKGLGRAGDPIASKALEQISRNLKKLPFKREKIMFQVKRSYGHSNNTKITNDSI
jgi:hypothetical protein